MGISQARKHMNEILFVNEGSKSTFMYHMDMNLMTAERVAGMWASSSSFPAVPQNM